jgi:hypothetical protein
MVKLTSLLETIKATPVSIGFLRKRVPKDVDVIPYSNLKGKHRSEVFKGKRALIVLIPKKDSKMGHFIVLLPRRHHIEYFSSLGNSPQRELDLLGEPKKIFEELLGKNFIYNKTKLQSGNYRIEDCAAWVLARIYLSKLKLREFVQLFLRNVQLSDPDTIVACLSVLLFQDR